jgi:hypothetical protein
LDRFVQRFGKRPSECHDLANGFHLWAKGRIDTGEFFKRPTRYFDDDIVERRLERRFRLSCNIVGDLVQGVTHGDECSEFCNGESCRFRGQRGRTTYTWIHLDDNNSARFGINAKLDIRATCLHADGAQYAVREVAQDLIFAVGKRLCWCDSNTVARVHTHRIKIFDRAHDDEIIGLVAHYFELVLLPSEHGLFEPGLADRRFGNCFTDCLREFTRFIRP